MKIKDFLEIRVINPTTRVIFKIFAPIIFPNDNWPTFSREELIATKNSGKDVTMPIIIKATTYSLTLRNLAILTSALTKKTLERERI